MVNFENSQLVSIRTPLTSVLPLSKSTTLSFKITMAKNKPNINKQSKTGPNKRLPNKPPRFAQNISYLSICSRRDTAPARSQGDFFF
ncbi:hypothetical protein SAICODRAFT_68274 [Saitoella complicata NRRL Y-17804]|uniref:uncharacterized protein n=1 Tax=Saitoella complicata (strain BCRC 22490 / CBS 7301 / JCM 7358 / NBRC 10748 / NRRL Y-17804) TaxID=698492 RepID=UPI00086722AC|nr:uncharacterized protein SAICODRAFT_68274 [Saitoella complicata NRRL Y-17804]ODQ49730.1 hypothetical protein SAICODRAFT_68274 [Saitoella complicata NRRL Y-17804]